jgi:hypothetical protein
VTGGRKKQTLSDTGGLYLELAASGGKWWRLAYRFNGKRKLLSLGTYPAVSLADARDRRDEAKKLIARGICQRSAYWSHSVIGIMEPVRDRHIGATW